MNPVHGWAQYPELLKRYNDALHGVQTGVKFAQEWGIAQENESNVARALKHLRTGINSALVESTVLAKLLVAKGIITEAEWLTALTEGMEEERFRYEALLSQYAGKPVTLG